MIAKICDTQTYRCYVTGAARLKSADFRGYSKGHLSKCAAPCRENYGIRIGRYPPHGLWPVRELARLSMKKSTSSGYTHRVCARESSGSSSNREQRDSSRFVRVERSSWMLLKHCASLKLFHLVRRKK
jgi:hypothetical protein